MSVKIIFSDIDGTFLTNDHRVSEKTQLAVKKLLEQGKKFVLVSARMPEAIYPITDSINLPRIPIISYSGGLVLTEDEKILYDKTIDADSVKNVLQEIFTSYPEVTVNYYAGRHWFVKEIDKRVQREMDITSATAEVSKFDELMKKNILPNKILIMCEPPTCEKMEKELGKIFPTLNVVRSSKILLEIMDKSVSKATGIEVLLKHYGVSKDDTIAFGDNYNDVEMLQFVGCGVVMDNAPDGVKKFADALTDSNEDDGIYNYLFKKNLIS